MTYATIQTMKSVFPAEEKYAWRNTSKDTHTTLASSVLGSSQAATRGSSFIPSAPTSTYSVSQGEVNTTSSSFLSSRGSGGYPTGGYPVGGSMRSIPVGTTSDSEATHDIVAVLREVGEERRRALMNRPAALWGMIDPTVCALSEVLEFYRTDSIKVIGKGSTHAVSGCDRSGAAIPSTR
jgi:hypothetical protein